MGIIVKDDMLFVMNTKNTTYAFFKDDAGVLVNLYWGHRIGLCLRI